eukprot:SAG31_NODE_809_length_11922_cov_15.915504_8_plen_123_part_00
MRYDKPYLDCINLNYGQRLPGRTSVSSTKFSRPGARRSRRGPGQSPRSEAYQSHRGWSAKFSLNMFRKLVAFPGFGLRRPGVSYLAARLGEGERGGASLSALKSAAGVLMPIQLLVAHKGAD